MNGKIGILDSGIGGVTVLKEILKLLPNEDYLYYSDSIHNPYGEKTKEEVLEYVDEIMKFFLSKNCKAVVFACNTATALTVREMREKYSNLIIIGIEPAYKVAHDYASNKKVLVMATPATIYSDKFLHLFHQYDNHNTILLPCPNLAKLIEDGDNSKIDSYLVEHLGIYQDIDAVVLGCTHYPLIQNKITKVLGNVLCFDGALGVSKRLKQLLENENLLTNSLKGSITFYDSSNDKLKMKRFYDILNND